jgi:hypothetical protein
MSNFDTYIARALEKGHKDLAKRMKMEKRMASALVRAILDRGYLISVSNGEDWPIRRSKSYRAVMDVLWQTDEEAVCLYDPDGRPQGHFFLVYGNDGYDLIADYGITDATEAIYNEVISPLSDKLCLAS